MRLSSSAIHEAAHAVAVERLGGRTDSVSIVPDRASGGRAHWHEPELDQRPDPSHRRLRERTRARGIIALAGAAAESRFGREPLTDVLARQRVDLAAAREAATLLALMRDDWHATSRTRALRLLRQDAVEFVSNNWSAILSVASALQHRKTLSGAAVARLVHLAERQAEPASVIERQQQHEHFILSPR
jgi:hypothetical protein